MATKTKKFQYNGEGAAAVHVHGQTFAFEPGKVRTIESDDPAVIAALSANPDLSEVKGKK